MSLRTRLAAVVTLPVIALVAACGGTSSPAQQPGSKYDSFDKISKAIGCTQVIDNEKTQVGVESKTCIYHNTGFQILHYPNAVLRESGVAQAVGTNQVSCLVLNDTWVVEGETDDVIAIRDKLGEGEVVTADEPTVQPSSEPTSDPTTEPTGPQVVDVPFGKRATNQETGQQVRLTKVEAERSVIRRVKDNPNWDYVDPDKQYLDLKAPKGDGFWIVYVAWKNVSKKPRTAEGDFALISENGTEYDPSHDEASSVLERRINGEDDWDLNEVNPGKGRTIVQIFSVPKGTRVDSIAWAGQEFLEDPATVYHLKVK